MKYIALIIACFYLIGCGPSQKDKDVMRISLENKLMEKYNETGNIIPMYGRVELRDIEKHPGEFKGVYSAIFSYEFKDHGEDAVYLTGSAGFDKHGHLILDMPNLGDGKIAVNISAILVNSKPISTKEIDTNKYVLDCFVNRNRYNGY